MFSQDTYFDNDRQSQKIVKTRHYILSECMADQKIIKNSDKNFLSKVTSFIVSVFFTLSLNFNILLLNAETFFVNELLLNKLNFKIKILFKSI